MSNQPAPPVPLSKDEIADSITAYNRAMPQIPEILAVCGVLDAHIVAQRLVRVLKTLHPLIQAFPRLVTELKSAYARITALEESTRWHLPDPVTGEWVDLPDEDRKIELSMSSNTGGVWVDYGSRRGGKWCSRGGEIVFHAYAVTAWRYRPAPYTPPSEEST